MDMTHKQSINRLADIRDELERLAAKAEDKGLTPEDEVYFADLEREFHEVDEHKKTLERDAKLERIRAMVPRLNEAAGMKIEHGSAGELDADMFGETDSIEDKRFKSPWDLSEMRTFNKTSGEVGEELRARALCAIEQMRGMNDARRAGATNIIEQFDDEKGTISKMALATSSPAYMRAFAKAAKGQEAQQTPDERDAVVRAMSLTDNAGGYLVPFQLDPTVIITSDGSLNQIRQAARQVVATGDVWNGVSAGETAWSWDAEAAEVSDDASTFAQPAIPIYKAAGFIPISIEAAMDEANVAGEVGRLLAHGKDTLEAAAFATGSGSGQPTGIVTALAGSGSEVASASADTFALEDVYALDSALPAKYQPSASWLANRTIYNDIRQFDTAGGAGLWERVGNGLPSELIGRPAYQAEDMDSVINLLMDNYVLIYGDFSNYVIADRIGMTVEFIPHLFHTTSNRPSGSRGWYAYFRAGADSVNDGGFALLNVT